MRTILFIVAFLMIAGWLIGILWFTVKGLFNIILIVGIVAFILGIMNRPRKA